MKEGMLSELGVALDGRGNVAADTERYASSLAKVFACGDMRARPIARRLGDPRGSSMRRGDRRSLDGRDAAAEVGADAVARKRICAEDAAPFAAAESGHAVMRSSAGDGSRST